jgi:LmbE family N-acetylglucosaminyl deacetylase
LRREEPTAGPSQPSDDETLFATFTCLRHRPHVLVVLKSQLQEDRGTGITARTREMETGRAMEILGCTWRQWPYPDSDPDWNEIEDRLQVAGRDYDHCFAPAFEDVGHEQHNQVAELARHIFDGRVTHYLTYRRGPGRTPGTRATFMPHWPVLKLRALACYESQIAEPSTRDWFLGEQWEYLA